MAKWQFAYARLDGYKGHITVTASNKVDAIKKGMEHARKNGEQITRFDCRLTRP